jgi:hypothetical protein
MTVADDIIYEVIFGRDNAYQQRVNSTCRRLVAEGKIVRKGNGGASDPFTYHLPPFPRRI